jgi:hypothetical protein
MWNLTSKLTPSGNITYGQEKTLKSLLLDVKLMRNKFNMLLAKVKQAGCTFWGQKQTIKT